MILTVANSSDTEREFSAWPSGEPDGPNPLPADSVVFDVTAVNAPATKSLVGRQDGFFQGPFFPATTAPGSPSASPSTQPSGSPSASAPAGPYAGLAAVLGALGATATRLGLRRRSARG
ncbi:hypothetical protein ACH4F6_22050 [Streptomyces sp. NPDC017936]|uniref:hypothetical protein n=1 Tax=Streptomyces sp. NPDC017936 TaxID=3365016 RepID=UPI0037895AB5